MTSLDELREKHPELGFAIYGYTPGEPVTLEVHTPDGGVFTWKAATVADAIALAFPPIDEAGFPATPETNVFD